MHAQVKYILKYENEKNVQKKKKEKLCNNNDILLNY